MQPKLAHSRPAPITVSKAIREFTLPLGGLNSVIREFTLHLGILILAYGTYVSLERDLGQRWPLGRELAEKFLPHMADQPLLYLWLFFIGGALLIVPPIYERQELTIVLQIGAAFSALIPLASLLQGHVLTERVGLMLAIPLYMVWREMITFPKLLYALNPFHWGETLKGKNGPEPLFFLASELLGWGYTTSPYRYLHLFASIALVLGCGFLWRYFWLKFIQNKKRIDFYWVALNVDYTIVFGIQAIHHIVLGINQITTYAKG